MGRFSSANFTASTGPRFALIPTTSSGNRIRIPKTAMTMPMVRKIHAAVVHGRVQRAQVGEGRALCALSGGVDSAVAAAIVQRAIGDRLTCVYVDHGMMRLGETEQVRRDFEAVFDTLKGQLTLEEHGARTLAGVYARVAARLLALAAAIWHNWHINAPIKRSLIAYDV